MRITRGRSTTIAAVWAAACMIAVGSDEAGVCYVDGSVTTSGNGSSPGAAFKTIGEAAAVMIAGDSCLIRRGTYRETVRPANSGTSSARITFRSFNHETVIISGADPVSGWSLWKNGIYQTSVELPVDGPRDSGFCANQVFANGEMMTEARWPNNTGTLLKPTLMGDGLHAGPGGMDTVVNSQVPALPEGWSGALLWTNDWYVSRTGVVVGGDPRRLVVRMVSNWDRGGYWFCLSGKLGLLDAAGEWYYDGGQKVLYFKPRDGGAPTGVEVKKRSLAVDLTDRSFITLCGITIFGATLTTSDASQGIVLDNIDARYVSHHTTLAPMPSSAGYPGIGYDATISSHIHDSGIMLRGKNHLIANNRIAFSAGNCLLLAGSGDTVRNCVIHDGDYLSSYAALIMMNGGGHHILNNTLYNCGRDAIQVNWATNGYDSKDNEIAYNDISGFGGLSNDLGGIYICCYQNQAGSRIHHNNVHDPMGYCYWWEVTGIYTDIGSYNATVDHNVVWNINVHFPTALKVAGNPDRHGVERVYNNTLLDKSYLPADGVIRNNIFRTEASLAGSSVSNNLFGGTDPKFADANHGTFTLAAGSPAIDIGMIIAGITDGYKGNAPDAGAFESGVAAWHAGADTTTPATAVNPPVGPRREDRKAARVMIFSLNGRHLTSPALTQRLRSGSIKGASACYVAVLQKEGACTGLAISRVR